MISTLSNQRLCYLCVAVELEPRLGSNVLLVPPTQSAVQNGHDPAVLIDTQAPELRAVLDEFPPSAVVPHPRLSLKFPELPPHRRADGRFAVYDIDFRGWPWAECRGWGRFMYVSRTRPGLLCCNVRLGAGAITWLLRLPNSVFLEGRSSWRRS